MILREDCKKLLLRLELLRNFYRSSKAPRMVYCIVYFMNRENTEGGLFMRKIYRKLNFGGKKVFRIRRLGTRNSELDTVFVMIYSKEE